MRMLRMNVKSIGTITDTTLTALSRLSFYWPFSWSGISALILGVLLAKWFWILFAPHAIFTAVVPERSAGVEAGRLFGVAVSTEATTQGIALANVQLLGVFAASRGKTGFAVLKLDDARQMGVAEGEEVTPGTRLAEVHADHVVLERAGIKQRINLDNISPGFAHPGIQAAHNAEAQQKNRKLTGNIIPEHVLSQIQSAQQKGQSEIKNSREPRKMMRMESSEAADSN